MAAQGGYLTEYAGDVVEYLVDQHEELRALLGQVLGTSGDERRRTFDAARQLLARHEAAEEAVLRPLTRQAPGGDGEADRRTGEEDEATSALAVIEGYDVDSIPFETEFRSLLEAVLTHAEKEETVEFPLLRRTHDPETLRRARVAVEEAEAGHKPSPVTPGEHDGGTFAGLLERARRMFGAS